MTVEYFVMLVARWLHILSATLAIGVPLYLRLVLFPAMTVLDEDQRLRLRQAIAARWRIIVYILIAVFLATGLYTFLVVARWKGLDQNQAFYYQLLFGGKVLLALGMFFISSALVGRSAGLAFIRANGPRWIGLLILLGLGVVGLSGVLRFLQ